METSDKTASERIMMDQVRMLLDEKRTFISIMNTGIFILPSQMLIDGILIAMSKFYETTSIPHLVIPFALINVFLLLLAGYLVFHSLFRIHHCGVLIRNLKKRNNFLVDLFD